MVTSAFVSAINLEAAEFALNQSIQSVSQIIQPFLQILPEQYQSFNLDLMKVELFQSLGETSIFQAIESANNFINSFQLIQNNFISTINGIAAPFNQIQSDFRNLQNSINQIKTGGFPGVISGLSSFSENIGAISTSINQISGTVKSLPNTIQSSLGKFKLF
jgi:methyl-accepting chemotaxis protein